MSFYRKYRPLLISEIDNVFVREKILQFLNKKVDQLPHAFLFSGPRGTGKTTAARIIAKVFNCTEMTKSGPCGACSQCLTITTGRNLDVLEIDAASNRGIDEIRQLRERINLSPSLGRFTIYIIDEVHMLTNEAFNALLKTLEEPPPHAVFILATTELHKVPPTIISRTLYIPFKRAAIEELLSALKRIVKAEKINIDDQALQLLSSYADGSFRDAVKMLEQLSLSKTKITTGLIQKTLSFSQEQDVIKLVNYMLDRKADLAISLIENINKSGVDIKQFLIDLLKKLENMLVNTVLTGNSPQDYKIINITKLINKLNQAYSLMKYSPLPQLSLEVAVVEYCLEDQGNIQDFQKDQKNIKPEVLPVPKSQSQSRELKNDENLSGVAGKNIANNATGSITIEKLTQHWGDLIDELKPINHSIAGVLRSSRPKSVSDSVVSIEAFYKFHQEKLSEAKTKDILSSALKKLFGESVTIQIVLGKK